MSLRQLASQTAIYGISSIGAKLLNQFLTPYLTRVLTTGEYGVYTYFYSLIPFALVILTLGLETGYFKFAGKSETRQGKLKVFATTWGTVIATSVAFLSVVLLLNGSIAGAMGYGDNPSFIWIIGAIIALDAVVAVPFSRLREEGRAGLFVKLKLLSVVITVVLSVLFYSALPWLAESSSFWATMWNPSFGIGYAFVANLIASTATFIIILPCVSDIAPRIDRRMLGSIMVFSLPLLLSGIANTANQFIDRQFIDWYIPDQGQLGIYGAVMKIPVILTVFIQMYRYAAEPYFLSNFKREDFVRMNAESLKYFFIVSVAIFIGTMLFVDFFALFIGREFREGMYILPIALLANVFMGLTFNLSFWYKQTGRTKFALIVTLTGLVFTVIANIALIPILGIMGAAIARLVCEAVMLVLSYWLNRKYFPVPYDLRRIGEYALVGGAIYGASILTAELPAVPKYLCNLALFSLFMFYAVRREKIDVAGLVRSQLNRGK